MTETRDNATHPMAKLLKIVDFVAALLFTPHEIYAKIKIHRNYDKLAAVELVEDLRINIISKSKAYHGIRIPGHKKRTLIYRQFASKVSSN